jgi:hypothetical protein
MDSQIPMNAKDPIVFSGNLIVVNLQISNIILCNKEIQTIIPVK